MLHTHVWKRQTLVQATSAQCCACKRYNRLIHVCAGCKRQPLMQGGASKRCKRSVWYMQATSAQSGTCKRKAPNVMQARAMWCTSLNVHAWMNVCMYAGMHEWMCMHACMHVCMHECACMNECACMCMNVHAWMCAHGILCLITWMHACMWQECAWMYACSENAVQWWHNASQIHEWWHNASQIHDTSALV